MSDSRAKFDEAYLTAATDELRMLGLDDAADWMLERVREWAAYNRRWGTSNANPSSIVLGGREYRELRLANIKITHKEEA
jgi:hypothetical protein